MNSTPVHTGGMYDQILGREEFYTRMRAVGMADEELDVIYPRMEEMFGVVFTFNAYKVLPEKERDVLKYGIDFERWDDVVKFVSRIKKFVTEHPASIDVNAVVEESVKQVYSQIKEGLEKNAA